MKTLTKYGIQTAPLGSQFWAMLNSQPAQAHFNGWGCSNVIRITEENGYVKYMVIHKGLFHYAHSNGSSCYVSLSEGYKTSNAQTAWRMHKHDSLIGSLANARQTVFELEGKLAALVDLINGD